MDPLNVGTKYAYWTVPEDQKASYDENKVSYLHKLVCIELRPDKYNPGHFTVQQLPISELAFHAAETEAISTITFNDVFHIT
jgi:hypothetical protein